MCLNKQIWTALLSGVWLGRGTSSVPATQYLLSTCYSCQQLLSQFCGSLLQYVSNTIHLHTKLDTTALKPNLYNCNACWIIKPEISHDFTSLCTAISASCSARIHAANTALISRLHTGPHLQASSLTLHGCAAHFVVLLSKVCATHCPPMLCGVMRGKGGVGASSNGQSGQQQAVPRPCCHAHPACRGKCKVSAAGLQQWCCVAV